MKATKIAITIDPQLLAELDYLVQQHIFPNRSQAIQAAIKEKLHRLQRNRFARECAKLTPEEEQTLAEEGMDYELEGWSEY